MAALACPADRHFDRRRAAALDRTSSRYFSFWMLNLIFLCLLAAQRVPESRTMFRSFLLVMFVAIGGDRLTIFRRHPYSVEDHIKAHSFDKAVTGRDLCFEHRNRDTVLFAYIF